MQKLILLGGGGHCKSLIDVIEQENKYIIAGIIDKKELIGTKVLGYEVIGCDYDLTDLVHKYKNAVVTVGHIKSNEVRVELYYKLKRLGYNLPVIISPFAYVSNHATVGEGSVVMHHSLINAGAKIDKNCIINTKALIEHDAVVEEHCHISTGAIVNGGTVIKANTFFGSNATSKEYTELDGFIKAASIIK